MSNIWPLISNATGDCREEVTDLFKDIQEYYANIEAADDYA